MGNLAVANTLILDEPTNHLDLESLTALNNGLIAFPEVLLQGLAQVRLQQGARIKARIKGPPSY